MTIRPGTALRGLIGIAISVAAIWILLQSVDLDAALAILGQADPTWVLAMIVVETLDVASRAARWRALLAPIAPVPYARVLGFTYIGYLANNVLPARLGELVRSALLGTREGLSRTTVLGTVVVERIVDAAIVVAVAAVAVVLLSVGGIVATAVLLGAAFVGLLVLGLIAGLVFHRLPGADRLARFVARWPIIPNLAARLRDGLAVAGRASTVAVAIGFSLVAWTMSALTFMFGGMAVGLELTFVEAALLTSGVALATIVPSGPGYVGTFELTAVAIATTLGADPDRAFAMALLVHAIILAGTSVGGVIALAIPGVGRPRRGGDPTPAPDGPVPDPLEPDGPVQDATATSGSS